MKKQASKIVAVVILTLAVAIIITGVVGFFMRDNANVQNLLIRMRTYSVMHTAGNSVIDEIARQAKKAAREYADANGYTRNQRTEYANQEEVRVRAEESEKYLRFAGVDVAPVEANIAALRAVLVDYYDTEAAEKQVYAERYKALYDMVEDAGDELNAVITEEYGLAAEAAQAALDAEAAEATKLAETTDASAGDAAVQPLKVDYSYDVTAILETRLPELKAAYDSLSVNERKVIDKLLKEKADAVLATLTATATTSEATVSEDDAVVSDELAIDYQLFSPSDSLKAMGEGIEPIYDALWNSLMTAMPALEADIAKDLREDILNTVYQYGEDFEALCRRYEGVKGEKAFSSSDRALLLVTSNGDSLIAVGIGLALLALCILFYRKLVKSLGMPRLVILMFLVLMCVMASLYGINVPSMIGNILKRTGMYGVLALAMLPGIQCGISLNMGMTVGIIAGLLSTLIALEMNMVGWPAFIFSCVVGILFAIPIGWAYAKLLNRLKGNEMTVSTYVGFSFVSLFCIAWMLLPFRNPKLTWALGLGLRGMHNMSDSFGSILNNLWAFRIGGVYVPTGLLLFLLLACLCMWLFSRSRTGVAMVAAGSNPRFAEAAGVNVNRMRTLGTILSTCIAAVGIIVYSQSFGFMQLYSGPRTMGFVAASAILIGGASVSRGKVSHVILGTFLFQGVLAMGIQVANAAISEGGLSEVMRILISNGIILYALTQSGGGKGGK